MLEVSTYLKFHTSENIAKNHVLVLSIFNTFGLEKTLSMTDPQNVSVCVNKRIPQGTLCESSATQSGISRSSPISAIVAEAPWQTVLFRCPLTMYT